MLKHLDGTVCEHRVSMPRKSDIAKHWRGKALELKMSYWDWGEPSCWACGFYRSDHDLDDPSTPFDEIFLVWNHQDYLERCHVVPKGMGGCNCPGNLVLLCSTCHRDNPDTTNKKLFLRWIQNRKNYGERRIQELKLSFAEFDLELNNLNYFLMISKVFLDYCWENAVPVGGRITDASKVACLIEWKEQFSEEQLLAFIPSYVRNVV